MIAHKVAKMRTVDYTKCHFQIKYRLYLTPKCGRGQYVNFFYWCHGARNLSFLPNKWKYTNIFKAELVCFKNLSNNQNVLLKSWLVWFHTFYFWQVWFHSYYEQNETTGVFKKNTNNLMMKVFIRNWRVTSHLQLLKCNQMYNQTQ